MVTIVRGPSLKRCRERVIVSSHPTRWPPRRSQIELDQMIHLFYHLLLMIRLVSRERIDHLRVRIARRVCRAVAAFVTPLDRLAVRLLASLQRSSSRRERGQQQCGLLFRQSNFDGYNDRLSHDICWNWSRSRRSRRRQRIGLGRSRPFFPLRMVILRRTGRFCQLWIGSGRLHHPAHARFQVGQPDQIGGRSGRHFILGR